ncbi:N-acetylglucosaminyldiphosphoundecaprenol N-acetyl-beta-D-mannosaminyltransferase [Haloferula luteola]|uniref:N-acetylglucosaminyldiphosphoundecaprenol N-acetyl-beta-D-mannosaminyltransferase n=1 Tax=Haloferula luteola TaxID=595692 RepID=A0A840V151_9BACT|nr:WecB/TagA/CpsF family glycosyltransferase [Haloferula luteola]MBB5350796.1 N-acetylglucosaminyldiphosphoundecaprenol N-acetyl-beta-D-mannosaminyltransferase [Haloferula luteola]
MKTADVIRLPVAVTDYAGAVQWILDRALKLDAPLAVEAANTHVAALARHDPEFGAAMKRFDLVVPDGMPLVWSINFQLPEEERLNDRVYGPTLMLETLKAAERTKGYRHFLLGGSPRTLEKLEKRFAREFPETALVGSYSPPFGEWDEEEFERIQEAIWSSGANLVWVCFGCPKQELWIAQNKDRLVPAIYFGIGAAFAFHAGEVSQAPAFLQKRGLEWAYRIAKEPRRLFRRYFVHNSLYIFYSLLDHSRA